MSEKSNTGRGKSRSKPHIGRAYRQKWITGQIKAKLLEEGHPDECAICGVKGELIVNHDNTGLVRGLLCKRCDRGLDIFEGDSELLGRAASYQGRPPTRFVYDESINLDVKPRAREFKGWK